MLEPLSFWDALLRLLLATVAGALLGWEREWHGKPAGLRTHIMVALGSALFMVLTIHMINVSVSSENHASHLQHVSFDPLRVIQGIIAGVGVLGAGAIIQGGAKVHGLTTAASIWLVAAIGVTSGIGYYEMAATVAAMGLLILLGLGAAEKKFAERSGREDTKHAS